MEHDFTPIIKRIMSDNVGDVAELVFHTSDLIQYLNYKTRSASRNAKARGSFANLYAIYVLLEDYIQGGFDQSESYEDYEGARYSDLLDRQRQLPFGKKLQNHALNHRLNQEFKKLSPQQVLQPVLRDSQTNRYWINERLLYVEVAGVRYNLARTIIDIINAYVEVKQGALKTFIQDLKQLQAIGEQDSQKTTRYIRALLQPHVDARIFEIVSYAILKAHYQNQVIYWGWKLDEVSPESLKLYKTGRTNANDGGIDFVMKPLGRFFQVTETINLNKYFLDIDKVLHYPITFVIKSDKTSDELRRVIEQEATKLYPVRAIVEKYMNAIEEVITIPHLKAILEEQIKKQSLPTVIETVLQYSQLEFGVFVDDNDS